MPSPSLAEPSTPALESPGASRDSGSTLTDGLGSFQILSLKEDSGACIATVICAGFASVLRFVLDRHDEWDLGTASDEFPCEVGGDEWWDCLGLVNDYMGGTQAERRQLNANLSAAYLALKKAA